MQTFISSDYHFSHSNIIKYDNRPFSNLEEMNSTIIRKHNARVKPEDTVYFLGDFGFFASNNRAFRGEGQPYKPEDFLNKMNGKYWNFIKGNHDKPGNKFHPKNESIILNQNGLRIQLIHDPLYAKIDYDLILCGHVHMAWKLKELSYCGQKRLIINVSCCLWDYYPVRLDELLVIYYKWNKEKLPHWKTSKLIYEYNQGTLAEKNKESYEK